MAIFPGSAIPSAAAADYTIDQSLRFNDGDNAYLSRTPGSAGNQKTWTVSFWHKRSDIGNYEGGDPYIFVGGSGTNPIMIIGIDRNDNLWVRHNSGSGNDISLITSQVFRDPSSWYHFVIAMDTTQSVEANRTKIYVNGSQVTAFGTATYPTLNLVTGLNDDTLHEIMKGDSYHSGYLAEFYSIDGQQLTPSSFGEEDSDTGQWKPIEVTDMDYGVNGFYQKYNQTALADSFTDSSTGGTAITSFTTVETTSWTAPTGVTSVDYLVVAGGGGGGGGGTSGDTSGAGGGGAGGVRTGTLSVTPGTSYTVTVGGGGSGANMNTHARGVNGDDSVFGSITSTGGGGGGTAANASNIGNRTGADGGSGGGGSSYGASTYDGGSGTTDQGYDGGQGGGTNTGGGGGGGASETGDTGAACSDGGDGVASSISGSSVTYGGGGGGGQHYLSACARGDGGSGGGGMGGAKQTDNATAGTANTGGGGGGGGGNYYTSTANGKAGGSGIVIISYEDPALARHTITANGDAANQRPQPHGITANGNANLVGPMQGTSAFTVFEGASSAGAGGDVLTLPASSDWNFGSSDFTVECWYYPRSLVDGNIFRYGENTAETRSWQMFTYTDGRVWSGINSDGTSSSWSGEYADQVLVVNKWNHIAFVRNGNNFTTYIDGKGGGEFTTTDSTSTESVILEICGYYFGGATYSLDGYLEGIRISDTARYTANFDPPTTAFSNDGDTLLLIPDGTDGSQTFTDSSSSSHSITVYGDCRWFAPKIGAGAMAFDGTGDYLDVADSNDFDFGTGEFCIEFWVKPDNVSDWQAFVSSPKYYTAGYNGNWVIDMYLAEVRFVVYNGTGAVGALESGSDVLVADTWQHVLVSRDSSGDMKMFFDGAQVASSSTFDGEVIEDGKNGIWVGQTSSGAGPGNLNGWMDELRISRIPRHTSAFTPSTSEFTDDIDTVLLIHADQTEGTGFQDKSTGLAISEKSRMKFDGNGDYLSIPASSDFAFGTDAFTVEGWVKFADVDPSGYWDGLYGNVTNTSGGYAGNWGARFEADSDTMRWYYGDGTSYTFSWAPDSGVWYHTAFSRSGTDLKFFVDGVQTGATQTDSTSYTCSQNVAVGSYVPTSDQNGQLNGYMDEVRVSDSARYTTTFTPKARGEQFTADANTLLLIHSDWEGGLGADSSGNYNTYTATNLVATDVVKDSPSNNFATLNPLVQSYADPTYSEGNLQVSGNNSSLGTAGATMSVSGGKWYWEVYNKTINSASWNDARIGIKSDTAMTNSSINPQDHTGTFWYSAYDGDKRIDGVETSYGASYTNGDIVSVALDLESGTQTIEFYKNNVSQGSLSLSGGVSTAASIVPMAIPLYSADSQLFNFGQDSSFAGNKTAQGNADGNGVGDFFYEPPSGYLALCTDNLPSPSIADPTAHFNTVAYSGDGTSPRTIDVGLQPDLTWLKIRTQAYSHRLFDSIRGADEALFSNSDAAEAAGTSGYLSGFTSTGPTFTANGSDERDVNESGDTYVVWNWKGGGAAVSNTDGSITSSVSVNTTAGFSIVKYTGHGSTTGTVGHGLSAKPDFIVTKYLDGAASWSVYNSLRGATKVIWLDDTSAEGTGITYWRDTEPTASVFSVGASGTTGGNANPYIAYCFHSVEGYSKIGTYVGNNSTDGTFVYLGFTPAYILLKTYDNTDNWNIYDIKRNGYNGTGGTYQIRADTNGAGFTAAATMIDLVSNGVKMRTNDPGTNSARNYLYMAFAETPFKTANAR